MDILGLPIVRVIDFAKNDARWQRGRFRQEWLPEHDKDASRLWPLLGSFNNDVSKSQFRLK